MRLFINSGVYPSYRKIFDRRNQGKLTFQERRDAYINDRFGALHILQPVLDGDKSAFFTNADDEILQRAWVEEYGVRWTGDLSDVLLAQIEEHRTEVFYNLDPMRFGSDFVRRLPGCVKRTICWRAAPSPGADFSAYDLVVCNFPEIIASWRKRGWRAEYFFPAHDPEMDRYAKTENRPIDVCFIGGYSRHHQNRAHTLEAVAKLSDRFDVRYYLNQSRLTCLAESTLAKLLPLGRYRRPPIVRLVSREPVFGRDLYKVLGSSKLVLNGAIDMAGNDRGNMRCFEAMGAGALLVSDAGLYPEGMREGETMLIYSPPQAAQIVERALGNWDVYTEAAEQGYRMIRSMYSKQRQWAAFVQLIE